MRKSMKISPEQLADTPTVLGDVFVQFSKRTGHAMGHIQTVVDGSKRIEWVRETASSQCLTPSKLVRLILNEAIDKKIRAASRSKESL